ncbi:MAG: hypothetical protein H7296_03425 [Bacteroidia bacterium]|nr:hypothetical protein [Bacteroidia bacterium]
MPESIVAVLGYPKRPDEVIDHVYEEIHLLHQSIEDGKKRKLVLNNNQEILTLLRNHKLEARYVPKNIDKGEQPVLDKLAAAVANWVISQTTPVAVNQIQDLFTGDVTANKISPEQKKLEDKFKSDNFDLINWFVISNN